jgi:hypothetical protein
VTAVPRSTPYEAALDRLSSLVLEDGRRWGEAATDFQWEDAEAVLDPDGAPFYHWHGRGRGASKTSDAAGYNLAVMLEQARPGDKLYAVASDRGQGRFVLEAMSGFVSRTPALSGAFVFTEFKVVVTRSGVAFEVLAADAPGSWGLLPYFITIDEIAQWGETYRARKVFEAVTSATAKTSSRMVILTTAGDPTHWSAAVLEHAHSDPLWRVHEVRGPAPWLSTERVAEQQSRLTSSAYRRLFENEWAEAEDHLATSEDIEACAVLDGQLEARNFVEYRIGLDLSATYDRTALIVAHGEPVDPRVGSVGGTYVVVDLVKIWEGSRSHPISHVEVEEAVARISRHYNEAKVFVDQWQSVGLVERLRQRGVRAYVRFATQASNDQLAQLLFELFRTRKLKLPRDERLIRELSRVRIEADPSGRLRINHDRSDHDDQAYALGLAALDIRARPDDVGPRIRVLEAPPSRRLL